VAVTDKLLMSVTMHGPMPVHAPDHPLKMEFAPGAAVSVTFVPTLKFALQVVPQLIPEGLLVIVPVPFPDF
jgi:hypothetical protein